LQKQLPTFAYIDKGLSDDQQSCILVKKGNFYGMGYLNDGILPDNINALQERLEPMPDNDYIRNLVYKHAATYPERCISYEH
jgi:DNA polymerase-3 subunit epsilon